MTIVKKNDFVAIKYTGYSNGEMFDSNIEENLKKLNSNAKPSELIVVVGQAMIVPGLDKALEGKETEKEYTIELTPKEGFGDRRRDLVRVIPLKMFHEKNVDPKPGMVFTLDNMLARIVAVSGARVTTDFNNPLSGKNLRYVFTVKRIVEDEHEKVHAVFEKLIGMNPEHEINDKEVIVKGPKQMEYFINAFNEKFKELIGKPMKFEFKEIKKDDKKKASEDHSHEGHDHNHEHDHDHNHEGHDHSHHEHKN
jgi:FKBP-type peptidyl-prolyl cis-trans isomerase SlyD